MCPHVYDQILLWDSFCEVGFVGSIDVLHDAHGLKAKHHVTFNDPFIVDLSIILVTHSNSHALEPQGVDEGFDLQKEEPRCQIHFPYSIMLGEIMPTSPMTSLNMGHVPTKPTKEGSPSSRLNVG